MEYGLWQTKAVATCFILQVLILVLMEYGLWLHWWSSQQNGIRKVLILVLMEYGLWQIMIFKAMKELGVLILVLMEYGLWLSLSSPCSSPVVSLNPCSNGIWSLTSLIPLFAKDWHVLILVLMEYGLWLIRCSYQTIKIKVLILVLMEYGLWHT